MTWRELVSQAVSTLAEAGVDSPAVDARLLAEHVAGTSLLLAPAPTPEQATVFARLVERRAQRHPLQHLTGVMYFRYLELPAEEGVFIVRPETEMLAGLVIDDVNRRRATGQDRPVVVDLCTGSGAIALAVATETNAQVYAVERDDIPFAAATRNCGGHVRVIQGDACQPVPELAELEGRVDIVVSNPPYVPPSPVDVESTFDPPAALWGGGDDGLDVPKRIVQRASILARPGGYVAIEHDPGQGEALLAHAGKYGIEAQTVRDLTGRPRFLTGYRHM